MAARAARFEAEAINARLMAAQTERAAAMSELTIDELAGMVDNDTGLFNEKFFVVTTEKRLSAARRGLRPLDRRAPRGGREGRDGVGHPAEPRTIAACLDGHAPRRGHRLPARGRPLRHGPRGHPRERRRLDRRARAAPDGRPAPCLTMWAGVACYPAHAFDPVRSSSRPSGPSPPPATGARTASRSPPSPTTDAASASLDVRRARSRTSARSAPRGGRPSGCGPGWPRGGRRGPASARRRRRRSASRAA